MLNYLKLYIYIYDNINLLYEKVVLFFNRNAN